MAASARLKLKQAPTDIWSIRERLALGASVLRSGDQNWVSVSRAIKPYGESDRPSEWFSQKNCALQYSDLLEKVETPKRKRERGETTGGTTETPGIQIVRKLTIERIEELKQLVQLEQVRYKKLKKELEEIRSGQWDERVKEIGLEIQAKQLMVHTVEPPKSQEGERTDSEESSPALTPAPATATATPGTLKKRPPIKLKIPPPAGTFGDSPASETSTDTVSIKEEEETKPSVPAVEQVAPPPETKVKPTPPASPLLSHLLKKKPILTTTPQGAPQAPPEETTPIPPSEIKQEPPDDAPETPKEEKEPVEEPVSIKREPVSQGTPDLSASGPPSSKLSVTPATSAASSPSVATVSDVEPDTGSNHSSTKTELIEKPLIEDNKDTDDERLIDVEGNEEESTEPPVIPFGVRTGPPQVGGKAVSLVHREEDIPPSPASSVMSNDTDVAPSVSKSKQKSSKGKGRASSRRSSRLSRGKQDEDRKDEEGSKVSDSSGDETEMESDPASSFTVSKPVPISESIPNSPASLSQCSDTEDEKVFKVWKKSIMLVWRAAANHKYANVFLHPVTDDIAPGYRAIVNRPMDLSTIKKNIEAGIIRTTAEFQRDMMLMFTNAIMYNNSDHNVYNMAMEMYDDVMFHIEQYVNTQMMVQSETKVLRTSRRSEVSQSEKNKEGASDKEDEQKKRRSSMEHDLGGKAKKRKTRADD